MNSPFSQIGCCQLPWGSLVLYGSDGLLSRIIKVLAFLGVFGLFLQRSDNLSPEIRLLTGVRVQRISSPTCPRTTSTLFPAWYRPSFSARAFHSASQVFEKLTSWRRDWNKSGRAGWDCWNSQTPNAGVSPFPLSINDRTSWLCMN